MLSAAVCYFMWGLVPIFWKQLADINAVELIAHRHLWSLVFVVGLLAAQGGLAGVAPALKGWRALGINFLSGTMLTANWLIYVWGVNNGHVIESSLGYFLVPLVNVVCASAEKASSVTVKMESVNFIGRVGLRCRFRQ